jgi:D-xylose transport system permease protein
MATAPEEAPDLTAATEAAQAAVPPELVAQTFGEYARAYAARLRNGQSGVLPVVVGLVATMLVFEAISPHHVFLSAGNLVNLFEQSAVFMVLAMAQTFALLLG